ncbi:hypothetical protein AVEN_81481-1 [Araneus ventricosus]|uniref:GCVT N-terminal domain-containing protein n=1 Tax=Araneus ventricosus TaxID=182803 RepID=A0A4Y2E4G7_ARAVE|nr:hypothetical protein AVEN_81481-1 [Araneus ventricosus]
MYFIGLEKWKSVETLMTNHNGGIIDILLVSKQDKENLHIVANTPKVLSEVQNNLKKFEGDARFQIPFQECYFTFQGPESENFLKNRFDEFQNLQYMCNQETEGAHHIGYDYLITRYSNTSEDGFGISCCCGDFFVEMIHHNFNEREIPLIGHEAKECLRIEAGNLSESDFDENTTPVEAKLTHLIKIAVINGLQIHCRIEKMSVDSESYLVENNDYGNVIVSTQRVPMVGRKGLEVSVEDVRPVSVVVVLRVVDLRADVAAKNQSSSMQRGMDIVVKSLSVGVRCKQSDTQDNSE